MKANRNLVVEPRWLRTAAAAAHVGISASTLEKLRASGDGPRFSRAGARIVLYSIADLNSWIEGRARGCGGRASVKS